MARIAITLVTPATSPNTITSLRNLISFGRCGRLGCARSDVQCIKDGEQVIPLNFLWPAKISIVLYSIAL